MPGTSLGLQKKLIYVRAYENSPTYFVSLMGIQTIALSTTAVAEAAPVDLVIVLDTSESMGATRTARGDFDPPLQCHHYHRSQSYCLPAAHDRQRLPPKTGQQPV